jgi:ABC-type Co2+ transport system permease subunit
MAQRFTLIETTLLSWFVAFVLMWVVIGNLLVLPVGILIYAVPLSLLEAFIATLIIKSIDKRAKPESLRGVSSGDG